VELEDSAATAKFETENENLKNELKKARKMNALYMAVLAVTFFVMLLLALFAITGNSESGWGRGNNTRANCSDRQ
jgi:hypothetical protein